MTPKVEKLVDNLQLGEGPHWDVETQSLYFVDTSDQSIHKYVPSTGKHTKANVGHVSIIIPVQGKNDQFVITLGQELALITWDGESEKVTIVEKLYKVDEDKSNNAFNDGKCDPSGRLWAGTCKTQEINDVDGNLWVAVFRLSKVIKIDPRKPETIADTIQFPAEQITSVAFGGPNLDELYVTSGRIAMAGDTPSTGIERRRELNGHWSL